MGRTRTHEEHLIDQLLTLVVIDRLGEAGVWHEVMKIMKAVWGGAWEMFCKGTKGFNLCFYVWKHGPLSKDLYRVLDSLVEGGLAKRGRVRSLSLFSGSWRAPAYAITDKGLQVLQQCKSLLEGGANTAILGEVLAAADVVAPLDPIEARKMSHEMEIPDPLDRTRNTCIEQLPAGTELIHVLEAADARRMFVLDDDWLETVEMMLSPEYEPGAMRKNSTKGYDDLFLGA